MMTRHAAAATLVFAAIGLPGRASSLGEVRVPSGNRAQVLDCRGARPTTASITGRVLIEPGDAVPSPVGLGAKAYSPVPSCQGITYATVMFDWSFAMDGMSPSTYRFDVSADRPPSVVATRVILDGVEKPADEPFTIHDGINSIVIFVKRREAPRFFDNTLPTPALVSLFKEEERDWIQFEIGRELVTRQDPSILPSLEGWLTHDVRRVRGNAAFVFAGLGDPRGFQVIVEILNDRSDRPQPPGAGQGPRWTLGSQIASDRYYAAHLLGDLRDARAVPVLIPLLGDSDVNAIVPWSLGQIGDPQAVPALIGVLDTGSSSTRVSAIYALETLRATDALPHLRSLLTDNARSNFGARVSVAEAARAAIATITGSTVVP